MEVVLESLKCEVIFVWLSAYPSKCRGDLFCALPLCVEVVLVERGVVYSRIVFAPNPQWRFLIVKIKEQSKS